MSDLAKTDPAPMAKRASDEFSPLKQLPAEWRKPVSFFYMAHSDILKGTMSLVTKIRFWIKEEGLTLEELRAVMRHLMTPDVCGGIQYVGQLHAALALAVAEKIKERRIAERRQRQIELRATGFGEPSARLSDFMQDFGKVGQS